MTVLVSRFPDAITPGALPLVPSAVTFHRDRLNPQRWIVYRWFDARGPHIEQSAPELFDALPEALAVVPPRYVLDWDCPEDFAPICYRLPGDW